MTNNGRLIINARGETVQVLTRDGKTRLQTMVLHDAHFSLENVEVSELWLSRQEAAALILKLADAYGFGCELTRVAVSGRR